jgi:hypothetical protein
MDPFSLGIGFGLAGVTTAATVGSTLSSRGPLSNPVKPTAEFYRNDPNPAIRNAYAMNQSMFKDQGPNRNWMGEKKLCCFAGSADTSGRG